MSNNIEELEAFAEKHYPEDVNNVISVGVLRAWIFENHYHIKKTGIPVVESLDLEKFIRKDGDSGPA